MYDSRHRHFGFLPWEQQVAELQKIQALGLGELDAPASRKTRLNQPLNGAESPCVVCRTPSTRRCSECASVSYCSEQHRQHDARWHARVCVELRQIAEDRAVLSTWTPGDLAAELVLQRSSARGAPPSASMQEYLCDFAESAAACRRVAGALASRPLTLAHAVRRLSLEPDAGCLRIHVVGAAEREARDPIWLYADALGAWPDARVEIDFFGPELPFAVDIHTRSAGRLTCKFHRREYRRAAWHESGRPQLVLGFNCGFLLYPSWRLSVLDLVGQEVPFVFTSYRAWEQAAEAELLASVGARVVLAPGPNPFASPAADRSTKLVNDVSYDNAHVMGVVFESNRREVSR